MKLAQMFCCCFEGVLSGCLGEKLLFLLKKGGGSTWESKRAMHFQLLDIY
jgi:hypothetical protein